MRNSALLFPGNVKIDVFGFKKAYVKNFSLGIIAAVLIHILLIGVYYFIRTTESTNIVNKYSGPVILVDITNQPPINIPVEPQAAVLSPGTSMRNSIPVPVLDDKAAEVPLMPTQKELSSTWLQPGTNNEAGSVSGQLPAKTETSAEEIPDRGRFIPYEKEPLIIESVAPEYPELARRAGIEGTVYVQVLVGKDGKPVKAVAAKYDSEIFVKPAVDAAMKFVFTPAIQHKSPVMVWTTIPFKFRLNN